MSDSFQDIESCLAKLRPSQADETFLTRLEKAADGGLMTLSPEEERFERMLASSKPAALDSSFLKSLEQAVSGAPFAVDEKIVLFTQGSHGKMRSEGERKSAFRPWAAAAAVALLGGLSAFYLPVKSGSGPIASAGSANPPEANRLIPSPDGVVSSVAPINFVPSDYQRNMQNAVDLGVVWVKGRPHRLFRVTYKDQASFTCKEGKRLEIEQPQIEHVLVPEKMD